MDEYKDSEGRLILINIEINGTIYTLVNIYAPNLEKNRNTFFKSVNEYINKYSIGLLVIGGDMNNNLTCMDRKQKSAERKHKKPVFYLKQLIKSHKLIDIWRDKHPNQIQFTWRRKNNNAEASRIDYFLICSNIRPKIISSDIRPALISSTDHQAVSLKIDINNQGRGRGYFKINNSILDSDEYIQMIQKLILEYKKHIEDLDDPRQKWDMLKTEIRDHTIMFCRKRSKVSKDETNSLERKLKQINIDLDKGKKGREDEKHEIEKQLETLYKEKAKGAQIRSRVKWVEEGERNSKFFLGLEKARQTRKSITALRDENKNIITDQGKILNLERNYYKNLYTSTNPDKVKIKQYIDNTHIDNKLSIEDSNKLEGELTQEECSYAVFNMKLNKSPGIDGLTVEFYRKFWSDLKQIAMKVFNSCYKYKELTDVQKIGVISLIYKKDDPLDLNNYRPISLLNVDTKIIAYALAQRIKPLLTKIISSDQNGYIKNRYIGYNIRQIQDIIDYAENFKVEGAILFLDFSKAFDSIEWDFIYQTLIKFGIQKSLLQWVMTMYSNIKGCIANNGWISPMYEIQRGIRQGCPLSALLFVLSVEIMACRLRQDNNINGFKFKLDGKTRCLKISQLADDTSIFVNSKADVRKALNIIEEFGTLSGLKLNRSKTEGLWIGKLKHCKDKLEDIKWSDNYVKCLGIYFGHDKSECQKLSFNKLLQKSQATLDSWRKRNLSVLGKITVIKSLIIPNITYLASVVDLNKKYVSEFKKLYSASYGMVSLRR